MDRFDPFVKYADVYGDIINWEKDPMNKPQNQNKYFFSDGKTYYEQICKMLRLMSVFKEAFNQIYTNEDEISEAWENFVNNLSASVVEGSEPDVTLTWTDDSVNFEFTMVPGVPGEQGVGITSISFNSDYTMTITLSDGNSYTSMSLKGETGPQGPQGETGSGLQILDVYATLADLQSAHPTGQPGDAYQVGSAGNYLLYIWSSSQSAWVQAGTLGTVSPYTSAPLMDGTASAGSQNLYARGDHVHPSDTSRASKEELDALIKTSQALIDQSFTYRESPAIQDGLVRIDKIKGNTLVWNQLVQNGNFADTNSWDKYNCTLSVSNNVATITSTATSGNIYTPSSLRFALSNGDKVLVCGKFRAGTDTARLRFNIGGTINVSENSTTTWQTMANIITAGSSGTGYAEMFAFNSGTAEYKDVMIFNLTKMGLDVTADQFRALFPLPYYTYDSGSLLSFNGSGIKTVGFNQWDEEWENGTINTSNGTNVVNANNIRSTNYIKCLPNTQYYFRRNGIAGNVFEYDADKNFIDVISSPTTFTTKSNTRYLRFYMGSAYGTTYNNDICINISSSENGEYESYTENTTNLPTLAYFPTGMKSAGSVYDELTPSKAITRIGSRAYQSGDESDTSVITDGTTTYYVLATPTENTVDLDLTFNAYEDGTEQLLPVNGSVPSTSPIIADMTYLSIDDAMTYILEKLESIPEQTEQRLEALEDDVADLQTDVGALQPAVSSLQTSVGNINTNIGQLSSTVAGHTASISDIQSDIADLNTDLGDLEDTVTDNTSQITTLETDLESTDGRVTNLSTSVSGLESTVTAQGTTVTALDSIIQDISNNAVSASLGQHELGFVAAYVDATLPANTGTMVTIPKPTIFPSNYTPLFIVGMTTGSYNVSICSIPWGFGSGDSVTCRVWNHGSQQTTQITVYILCMRQRQSQ